MRCGQMGCQPDKCRQGSDNEYRNLAAVYGCPMRTDQDLGRPISGWPELSLWHIWQRVLQQVLAGGCEMATDQNVEREVRQCL